MSEDDRARPVAHPVAHPVSGEIMAAGQPSAPARPPADDVSDAEYETVAASGHSAPTNFTPGFAPESPASGMDFLRAGARAIDDRSRRGGALFWTLGLSLVALAFWVSGGHALVRQQVAALAPAEIRVPLRIGDVTSRVERHNGRDVLFVEGRAENHGPDALALPAIAIAVTGYDGATTRYYLGTRAAELAPGDRYAFSSRLEAPANGVRSVAVTFQEDAR